MSFTPPTAADLKARYPIFADVADATVAAVLDDAAIDVGDGWADVHRAPAMLALAAHRMSLEGLGGNDIQVAAAGLGQVTKYRAGDTEIDLAKPSASASQSDTAGYGSTPYGRRYLELRSRSFPAVAVL